LLVLWVWWRQNVFFWNLCQFLSLYPIQNETYMGDSHQARGSPLIVLGFILFEITTRQKWQKTCFRMHILFVFRSSWSYIPRSDSFLPAYLLYTDHRKIFWKNSS